MQDYQNTVYVQSREYLSVVHIVDALVPDRPEEDLPLGDEQGLVGLQGVHLVWVLNHLENLPQEIHYTDISWVGWAWPVLH